MYGTIPMSADDELVDHWRTGVYPYRNLMSRACVRSPEVPPAGRALEVAVVGARLGPARRHLVRRSRRGRQGRRDQALHGASQSTRRHVVALEKPTPVEQGQWYFQRYVQHLPTRGEIVLFDRSWYNRAGVERVMGFCTDDEVVEFLRQAPEFERNLTRSGVHLIKFWFSVSREEQRRRFRERERHPLKQWKLSPVDIASLDKWDEYTAAKQEMFLHTDAVEATVDRDQVRLQEARPAQRDPLRAAQAPVRGKARREHRSARSAPRRPRVRRVRDRRARALTGAEPTRAPKRCADAAFVSNGRRTSGTRREVFVTVTLGVRAGSLALVAFGLDSIVEIFASTVVIRNLRDDRHDPGDRRIHRALRRIAARLLAPRRLPDRPQHPWPRARRSPRQLTPRRRLPGVHCLRHARPRPTQARDRRRARQRDAARGSRDDPARRVPGDRHPHRAWC